MHLTACQKIDATHVGSPPTGDKRQPVSLSDFVDTGLAISLAHRLRELGWLSFSF